MHNDDITRLADSADARAKWGRGTATTPTMDSEGTSRLLELIASELRALERTDHVEDKLGMVAERSISVDAEIVAAMQSIEADENEQRKDQKQRLLWVLGEYDFSMPANAFNTIAGMMTPAPDHSAGVGGMVPAALINAGGKLANAAFNLAQSPSLSDRERKCLDEVRKEWDAALRALTHPADAIGGDS